MKLEPKSLIVEYLWILLRSSSPFQSEPSRLETYASRLVAQQCEQIDVHGDAINLNFIYNM